MSNKRRENRSVSSKSHSAVECTFGPTKNSAQKIKKWFDMYGRSASIWNIVCDWLGKQLRDCDITMRLSMKTMEVQIKGEQWNKRFRTVNREGGGGGGYVQLAKICFSLFHLQGGERLQTTWVVRTFALVRFWWIPWIPSQRDCCRFSGELSVMTKQTDVGLSIPSWSLWQKIDLCVN